MATYIKPSFPVEAYQWDGEIPFNPAKNFAPTIVGNMLGAKIMTEEGQFEIIIGSYVVKGIEGEYWAVKESIFEKSYLKLSE